MVDDVKEFINVYHFAPLGSGVTRDNRMENDVKEETYTGWIQVSLKNRTPLFIPDINRKEEVSIGEGKVHCEYPFFSYDGKTPVIPGSSLRGMLRSVYETVTNSCLSVIDSDERPVKRTSDIYEPGLLCKTADGKLFLYKAKKAVVLKGRSAYNHAQHMGFKEGQKIKIKVQYRNRREVVSDINRYDGDSGDWETAYYFKGEQGVKKVGNSANTYAFYLSYRNNKPELIQSEWMEVDSDGNYPAINNLLDVLASYDKQKKGFYREYTDELKKFLKNKVVNDREYFPVHFSQPLDNSDVVYLSPACITKEVYYTSIEDILKEQGEYQNCNDIKKLCPACQLFGMVGKNKDFDEDYPNAWASSVRVQDAYPKGSYSVMDKVTLLELASPKESCSEFYLQRPEVKRNEEVLSWTYDYYVKKGKLCDERQKIKAIPKLAGRKYYWHHEANLPEFVEKTERNCTVVPLKRGASFEFKVYFERITEIQLRQLIWICNISSHQSNGRAKYGYKLGKGKPLGLGSVELRVQDVQIRCLKNKDGGINFHFESYEEKFGRDYKQIKYCSEKNEESAGFDSDVEAAFMRLCCFDSSYDGSARKWIPVVYPLAAKTRYNYNRQARVNVECTERRVCPSVCYSFESFRWFVNNRFHYKEGNIELVTREDLVFKNYLMPLTTDNGIKLPVNANVAVTANNRDEIPLYTKEYPDWVKATRDCPTVGCIVEGVVWKNNDTDDYLLVKANRREKSQERFLIRIKKGDNILYRIGDPVTVKIKRVWLGRNGNIMYNGEDIKNR